MNKTREKKIRKYSSQVMQLIEDLQDVLNAEQEYFDNLSEKQQESEKGENSSAAISELEKAVNSLEEAQTSLDEAAGEID